MTNYCFRCGNHTEISAVTYLCGTCTQKWIEERQQDELRSHRSPSRP